jgi:hypothetical protein
LAYAFTLDDVAFLRSPEGRRALEQCFTLGLTEANRVNDVSAARKIVGPEHAASVLETVVLRRRAASKVESSANWLFTSDALQQASASLVARHRASRLKGRDVHDVTCSVGADLVELARTASHCVGSDVDSVRLAMANHNCARAGVSPALLRADALRPTSMDTVAVADPSRRDAAGNRIWRSGDFVPSLDELAVVYARQDLVVKCAPGIDPAVAPWAGEVELVSLDGQVREACLWSRGLATVSRRATVIRSNGTRWTVTDAESDRVRVGRPGEWIVDPDGAVVRAGLVRHFAARHGLWQLDERIAYLTGDKPPKGMRAFRVLEFGPFTEKSLRSVLRKGEVGRLEILIRGLPVDPDLLRRRMKLRGDQDATVVLTRIGRSAVAFVCQAEVH